MAQKVYKGIHPDKIYLVEFSGECKTFYSDTYSMKLFEKLINDGVAAQIWEYDVSQCIARGDPG